MRTSTAWLEANFNPFLPLRAVRTVYPKGFEERFFAFQQILVIVYAKKNCVLQRLMNHGSPSRTFFHNHVSRSCSQSPKDPSVEVTIPLGTRGRRRRQSFLRTGNTLRDIFIILLEPSKMVTFAHFYENPEQVNGREMGVSSSWAIHTV